MIKYNFGVLISYYVSPIISISPIRCDIEETALESTETIRFAFGFQIGHCKRTDDFQVLLTGGRPDYRKRDTCCHRRS